MESAEQAVGASSIIAFKGCLSKIRETRNRKHRRAAAKPAACAQHP